jgi:hypothetical protein
VGERVGAQPGTSSALAWLRRDRYEQATLWVFSANDRARSFYRRVAFELDGREDQRASGYPGEAIT